MLTPEDVKQITDILVDFKKDLLTKEDAKVFATKDDLKAFATKDDLLASEERIMAAVGQEFHNVYERFDQVDSRFDQMDAHLTAHEGEFKKLQDALAKKLDKDQFWQFADDRIGALEADNIN